MLDITNFTYMYWVKCTPIDVPPNAIYFFNKKGSIQKHYLLNPQVIHTIQNLVSSCICNPDGILVSWMMVRLDGSWGLAHTLEEYRCMGLCTIILASLYLEQSQNGRTSFAYCSEANEAINNIAKKLGSILGGETKFVVYSPTSGD